MEIALEIAEGKGKKTPMEMQLVRILDLVGIDVNGLQADMRTRNADGSLMYEHAEKLGPRIVQMKRVHTPIQDKHKWLRWEWLKDPNVIPFDCGFSGIWLDSARAGNYYLLMETRKA